LRILRDERDGSHAISPRGSPPRRLATSPRTVNAIETGRSESGPSLARPDATRHRIPSITAKRPVLKDPFVFVSDSSRATALAGEVYPGTQDRIVPQGSERNLPD